ncbi:lipopolysaccharide biosynthesis protein [Pelagicoccus sp. SDUM812002]|uniref:lipopolysaccharide biosynthesis protein n=1 Tax=Pelagicoccus sp. SDUM812002 TaxID=3041266 RepID=UPI00280F607D|nr:lipopolysaccharide biosynthesis protein [Pelagicoccus sp. SDUM812002]MDQ8186289.1 lipopolysaccharide biosynthesis protein [Pelagicoccus sp. SDUM812002]
MTLKQKTASGLLWSFVDNFANLSIQFVVGIILARILLPHDFGLVGILTFFIAISQSLVDGGFPQALIRKERCTQTDYSTVFFFNLAAGLFASLTLYLSAPTISQLFEEPTLEPLLRVFSIVPIIRSLTAIQETQLIKKVNFKLQARISIIASTTSGIGAVAMAYNNFGVWSLVALQLNKQLVNSLLLWSWNRWLPSFTFSRDSFKELFDFGSKLLASSIISSAYQNIQFIVIGKFFSISELGYYTRAIQFRNLPAQNITTVIQRVTYPILSSIQSDIPQLRVTYQKLIRCTVFITFTLVIGMASLAESLITTLIGEKWLPAVIYLQMLCFIGMFYPLHALNLNILKTRGRSDLFLKLEIIKKLLATVPLGIGIAFGIKAMIGGMMINTLISYYLNSQWSGRLINYPIYQQIRDIVPSFTLACSMGIVVHIAGLASPTNGFWTLLAQMSLGASSIIAYCELTRFSDYIEIKNLVLERLKPSTIFKNEKP